MEYKEIQREVVKSRQSWDLLSIYEWNGHKLRVKIKRDSYDFQSYAKVEHFHNGQWVTVTYLPYQSMTPGKAVAKKPEAETFLQKDEDRLLALAAQIL